MIILSCAVICVTHYHSYLLPIVNLLPNYSTVNWSGLRNYLSSAYWLRSSGVALLSDEYWDIFVQIIFMLIDEFVPIYPTYVLDTHPSSCNILDMCVLCLAK